MKGKLKIAIIGLSGLEALGIRCLIHDECDANIESYRDFNDFHSADDERDIYVASADVFVMNTDFFLPRKQRALVVVGRNVSPSCNAGVTSVSVDSDEAEIIKSLQCVLKNIDGREPQHDNLSAREIEVLKLISSGKINKEIADQLCISINTVITHRKNISSKLGIKSASGLSLYAMMNGII